MPGESVRTCFAFDDYKQEKRKESMGQFNLALQPTKCFFAVRMTLPLLGAFVFFIILLILFYGIRLDAKVLLRGYFCEIKIKLILFFGIIRIKLRYCIEYEPFNGITVFQINNRQLKPVRPRKKRRDRLFGRIFKALPRSLSAKKIEVAGEIGKRDDAFLSVLICGIVSVFMDALFRFILNVLIKVKRSENCVINIFPAPNRSTFNLNMAGIVRVNLIKLFLNVFIRKDKTE